LPEHINWKGIAIALIVILLVEQGVKFLALTRQAEALASGWSLDYADSAGTSVALMLFCGACIGTLVGWRRLTFFLCTGFTLLFSGLFFAPGATLTQFWLAYVLTLSLLALSAHAASLWIRK